MVWERFHHICRRALAPLRPGESLAGRIRAIESDRDTALYGAPLKPGTLPRRILDWITEDLRHDRAYRQLEIYASLNLATETPQPLSLKRVARYLAWVVVPVAALLGIYLLLVMTGFLPQVESIPFSAPSLRALFHDYGSVFAVIVAVFLGLALMLGHALRGLADWPSGRGRNGLTRLLVFPKATAVSEELEAVALFPLGPDAVEKPSNVAAHLWMLAEEGIDTRYEMEALIRCRQRTLIELCERQICVLYTAAILLIGLTAGLFLVGLSP
ncbi:MAG: hypothetical protein ACQERE_04590, partial [Pseudomonadota bacterium]